MFDELHKSLARILGTPDSNKPKVISFADAKAFDKKYGAHVALHNAARDRTRVTAMENLRIFVWAKAQVALDERVTALDEIYVAQRVLESSRGDSKAIKALAEVEEKLRVALANPGIESQKNGNRITKLPIEHALEYGNVKATRLFLRWLSVPTRFVDRLHKDKVSVELYQNALLYRQRLTNAEANEKQGKYNHAAMFYQQAAELLLSLRDKLDATTDPALAHFYAASALECSLHEMKCRQLAGEDDVKLTRRVNKVVAQLENGLLDTDTVNPLRRFKQETIPAAKQRLFEQQLRCRHSAGREPLLPLHQDVKATCV